MQKSQENSTESYRYKRNKSLVRKAKLSFIPDTPTTRETAFAQLQFLLLARYIPNVA